MFRMYIFTVLLCDGTSAEGSGHLSTHPSSAKASEHLSTHPNTARQCPCVRLQKDKVHLLNLFNNGQWKNTQDFFKFKAASKT